MKQITHGAKAREHMIKGIDVLANTVKVTLGPKGRNVALAQEYGPPKITKDGVTVAQSIELRHPEQNVGAQLLKAVASKTANVAGDGTTTATVLAQAIVKEGNKAVAAGANPMDLKRGIDLAVEKTVESIKEISREISTSEEIAQVGSISANGDKEIGKQLAIAMEKVGKEGVLNIQEARNIGFEIEIVEGLKFDRGYLSPYFVTDQKKMRVELENPFILIYEKKIASLEIMMSLLKKVSESGQALLIIAEEVEGEALSTMIVNKLRGNLRIATVKAPEFGDQRQAVLEDIAKLTGGQFIKADSGVQLENIKLDEVCGRAKKVVISKDDTALIGGAATKEDLDVYCEQLRTQIAECHSEYHKTQIKERLGKLTEGVAILKVGGATEIEVQEKKDRVEDAAHATRAAIAEGIVPGGGVTLFYAIQDLKDLKGENEDQQTGINIIKKALEAPLRQIVENAGMDGAVVIAGLLNNSGEHQIAIGRDSLLPRRTRGFNAQTMEYVDMFEAGIIDPTKVVRTALQDAASVASLIITTESLVVEDSSESIMKKIIGFFQKFMPRGQ